MIWAWMGVISSSTMPRNVCETGFYSLGVFPQFFLLVCSWLQNYFWFVVHFPSHRKPFLSISPDWEFIFVKIDGWVRSPTIWMHFPIVSKLENVLW